MRWQVIIIRCQAKIRGVAITGFLQGIHTKVNLFFSLEEWIFQMIKVKIFFLCFLVFIVGGCAPGSSLFGVDPLSGGVDAGASKLLDIPLPAGLQRYGSHGFVNQAANGNKEGLEILRGSVNSRAVAVSLFNTLKSHGWQLLGAQRKNSRAAYLYAKNGEHVIISFHPQGNLTIVELWRASQLPEGTELSDRATTDDPETSLAGEEYGPLDDNEMPPVEEKWGKLEEREL